MQELKTKIKLKYATTQNRCNTMPLCSAKSFQFILPILLYQWNQYADTHWSIYGQLLGTLCKLTFHTGASVVIPNNGINQAVAVQSVLSSLT